MDHILNEIINEEIELFCEVNYIKPNSLFVSHNQNLEGGNIRVFHGLTTDTDFYLNS